MKAFTVALLVAAAFAAVQVEATPAVRAAEPTPLAVKRDDVQANIMGSSDLAAAGSVIASVFSDINIDLGDDSTSSASISIGDSGSGSGSGSNISVGNSPGGTIVINRNGVVTTITSTGNIVIGAASTSTSPSSSAASTRATSASSSSTRSSASATSSGQVGNGALGTLPSLPVLATTALALTTVFAGALML